MKTSRLFYHFITLFCHSLLTDYRPQRMTIMTKSKTWRLQKGLLNGFKMKSPPGNGVRLTLRVKPRFQERPLAASLIQEDPLVQRYAETLPAH